MASTAPTRTTFTDNTETYEAALMSLFSGAPSETEAHLSKLFTPSFIQRSPDQPNHDFASWVKHIRWLREIMPPGSVNLTVAHFLREGNQIAERHSSTTKRPDGKVGAAETFMWVEVTEDGRIDLIVEMVKPKEE